MTPDVKRRLDAAAELSGRSQSQEAEMRLERSFREPLAEASNELVELLDLFTRYFAHTGKMKALSKNRPDIQSGAWVRDQDCLRPAIVATVAALMTADLGTTKADCDQLVSELAEHFEGLAKGGLIKE
ncbi:TraY domain-containing protein [Thalassobaculum sp. OXR-137]|uniref:TraY domain-containing protein n=1 Tax=Thalassobaculum sp. OXR-137 TaxID=3100173 RepID=UPI002AC911FB|nr:TraY domain-containing protein [Thalassobaculum sp. OXR-137]WPZ33120.1 TraY domain-containing protein [Thalassobaculum sp. OXR-137]